MKIKRLVSLFLVITVCLACFCACASSDSKDDKLPEWSNSKDDELPKWSKELENEIYKARREMKYGTTDGFENYRMIYYGRYSGYEAVQCYMGSSIYTPRTVGGHLFAFGGDNIILLYKDGEFIDFDIAYYEGKLSQEDADKLYKVYCRINSIKPDSE